VTPRTSVANRNVHFDRHDVVRRASNMTVP
jgi:hypothetical protein